MKLVIVVGLAVTTSLLAVDKEPAKRLREAASVFSEVMATPTRGFRRICWRKRIASSSCQASRPGHSSSVGSTGRVSVLP